MVLLENKIPTIRKGKVMKPMCVCVCFLSNGMLLVWTAWRLNRVLGDTLHGAFAFYVHVPWMEWGHFNLVPGPLKKAKSHVLPKMEKVVKIYKNFVGMLLEFWRNKKYVWIVWKKVLLQTGLRGDILSLIQTDLIWFWETHTRSKQESQRILY